MACLIALFNLLFQAARGCKFLSARLTGQRSDQRSPAAPAASAFPAQQSLFGPGFARRQLSLPALLSHSCQLLPGHKYPSSESLTKTVFYVFGLLVIVVVIITIINNVVGEE